MSDIQTNENLILALPKGRILKEVMPIVRRAGIEPEAAFDRPADRKLRFTTNIDGLDIIRVRSFDVATFVAFGGAHLGVVGNDVLMEFNFAELYAPLDLNVGHCRISVAEPADVLPGDDASRWPLLFLPSLIGAVIVIGMIWQTAHPGWTKRMGKQRGVA